MAVVALLLIRKRGKKNVQPLPENLLGVSWRRISYVELERGTSSFSETNLLGRGSFGSVYKGILSDGLNLAVKLFNLELKGASYSFNTESEILSSLRHRNLVQIIGCCVNAEFRALILEYMSNGSLEKWLHSDNYCLDLLHSLQIAIDVALALEYLHHGHTFPVVHCDVKPSNVLLDEDMTARVGDFGISKLFDGGEAMVQTQTVATIGYAAPEYGSEGKVSTKGDVYSYGILLLEMFTGKKPTDDMFDGKMGLRECVSEALQENAVSEIVASGLLSRDDEDFSNKEICVSSIFELAMKCLAFEAAERINMVQLVASLNKIKAKVTT
ncbi:probable LRR receptor-like serine/threonine-protein kinase At3g47570 [Salvia miltiorrhiza]|uniref:probable LRR receptor-like serine/threonine-protein kinase At3g47570 n=1 Tax=Salvia miltiorrhiza TaxID=226208 RepID=UPI0025ABF90C|nr:probable LRR receptor-like serine/threonine-protein kinase At3g47570 [Salvia miltiorrhiza]